MASTESTFSAAVSSSSNPLAVFPPDSDAAATVLAQQNAVSASTIETPENPEKKTKIIRRKRRPARVQIDPSTIKSEPPPQTGTIYNIWYNKWSGGDREDKYLSKHKAPSRCSIATDSGYTRADKVTGSFFCLYFARGVCPRGHECEYLHRLPGIHDLFNPNIDCFGRDKFSDYRDDMGGVGTFMRQNRTLYVGRIHVTDDIEEVVARHFAEWGQIDRIRVLNNRGVAFVTYMNEANSQFAKEAMAHQSLDHNEVLNVRWATVDPNPSAQKREAQRIDEQAAEAIRKALPAEFVAELEGRDPEARKRKKIEGGFGLQGYEPPDEVWYAQTKRIEEAGTDKLEPRAQQPLIQDSPSANNANEGGGILTDAVLATLRGCAGPTLAAPPTKQITGPLVAYGSDDDSD
ncbi:Pre-mRNA-splicing factor [Ophidiomyces ophidiicola]|uniref:Pre-mRNA-splicing factor n=1 Tax=Ophidiomyces ophidiicola TaxID=1387563 RepID=A0ACB8UYQ9_9EURO|nr:Pre-mRNA-splicing factor [Ophidiomyces ophidiicola]KAI1918662.1 Pre-mRNA-splicing factor [Ophidiomyces ophidiicola]KAI1944313.1 Pre-mRNA-splicing factor [Ophidiomyces ophidiicola]KAI1949490.1 Pre-mRNA-splicing factor [Ophidiomyces ophidiicola]KAI1972519.1 Pre-mRNA-splicing factor [Ophidiomyces ophidiicola]KAI2008000.1 Pre-mRNA-splicing factor [Ophidiomyces ophidiicola]